MAEDVRVWDELYSESGCEGFILGRGGMLPECETGDSCEGKTVARMLLRFCSDFRSGVVK